MTRRGGRVPRWLRITLLVIASVFVLYLLAANVILRTHLLRGWLGKDESKLKVEYSSAWSLYPGHVAVRDLSIRFQDKSVQMLIAMDRGTLRIDPFAAAKRTFRISKLTAEGATFRLRQKMETLEGNEGRVRAFPPIEGFADPPVEKKVPEPPIPDDQYKLWTIDMPDISASMREVWVMEFRYRGEGTLTGGFHMRPKREMWVPPSTMLTHGGTVSLGERDLIRGGDARLDARFSAFDLRDPKGVEILRYLTASVHQEGELVLPSIGATYVPAESHVEITKGAGPVTIDVAIERGVIQPSTRVKFHTDDLRVAAPSISVETDLDVIGRLEPAGAHSTVVVETTAAHASGTPALDVRDARAVVDLGNDDLASAFSLERLSASVLSAHTPDLHAWNAFAPPNSTYDGGAVTVAARAELRGSGALEGRVDVALDKAKMTIGPFVFLTTGKVWTNVESEDVEKAVAFPGAGVDVHDVSLRLLEGHAEGLWLRSRFEKALLTTSGAPRFDSDIVVDSGPGERTLELFTRLAHLPDVAADAAAGSQLAALLHLRVAPGLIALDVTRAKNGALESRGRVQKRTGSALSGAFLVSVGPFHAGLDLSGGGVSVVPLAGGGWLEEKLQKR